MDVAGAEVVCEKRGSSRYSASVVKSGCILFCCMAMARLRCYVTGAESFARWSLGQARALERVKAVAEKRQVIFELTIVCYRVFSVSSSCWVYV
jgi:hypothetical protein